MSVNSVQQPGQQVAADGQRREDGHEEEGEEREDDASVADQVGDKQEHVVGGAHLLNKRLFG